MKRPKAKTFLISALFLVAIVIAIGYFQPSALGITNNYIITLGSNSATSNSPPYTFNAPLTSNAANVVSLSYNSLCLPLVSNVLSFNSLCGGSGGGTPALPYNSIQYNNKGVFGGSSCFTFNYTTNTLFICGNTGNFIWHSLAGLSTLEVDGLVTHSYLITDTLVTHAVRSPVDGAPVLDVDSSLLGYADGGGGSCPMVDFFDGLLMTPACEAVCGTAAAASDIVVQGYTIQTVGG